MSQVGPAGFNVVPFGSAFSPFISGGRWFNACGCTSAWDCSCSSLCEVVLPSTASVTEVVLDGAVLDPSAWRVDNGNRLVRTDGECWPACQNMADPSEPLYEPVVLTMDTAEVTFTRSGSVVHVSGVQVGTLPGGAFSGTAPWSARGQAIIDLRTSTGTNVGIFNLFDKDQTTGLSTIGGSAGAGWGSFEFVYSTEDAAADPVADGTFEVTYYAGVAPNDLFRYAAGVLAAEFYKACSGKDCRLPAGVTNISRAGISMEIAPGTFPGGMTGITEVDAIIRIYNPYALKSPPRVLSPDRRFGRIQTGG